MKLEPAYDILSMCQYLQAQDSTSSSYWWLKLLYAQIQSHELKTESKISSHIQNLTNADRVCGVLAIISTTQYSTELHLDELKEEDKLMCKGQVHISTTPDFGNAQMPPWRILGF